MSNLMQRMAESDARLFSGVDKAVAKPESSDAPEWGDATPWPV